MKNKPFLALFAEDALDQGVPVPSYDEVKDYSVVMVNGVEVPFVEMNSSGVGTETFSKTWDEVTDSDDVKNYLGTMTDTRSTNEATDSDYNQAFVGFGTDTCLEGKSYPTDSDEDDYQMSNGLGTETWTFTQEVTDSDDN